MPMGFSRCCGFNPFEDFGARRGEPVPEGGSFRRLVELCLSVSTSGKVAEAYRPEPLASDLLSIIRGKSVDTLGACPICKKLFERLRKDQRCDNRRCRDAYRQRRYRAQQPKYGASRCRYRKEVISAKELISLHAALRHGSGPQSDAEPLAPVAL
jgi:hypothetical protein